MSALPTIPDTYYPQTRARMAPRQVPMVSGNTPPIGGHSGATPPGAGNQNPENVAGAAMTKYQAAAGNDLANRLTPEMAQNFSSTTPTGGLTAVQSPEQAARFKASGGDAGYTSTLLPNGNTRVHSNDDNAAGRGRQNFTDQFNTALKAGTGDDFAARVLPGQKPPTPQAGFTERQGAYQDSVADRAAMLMPGTTQNRRAASTALANPPTDPRVDVARINATARQESASTAAAAAQSRATTAAGANIIGRGITALGGVVSSLLKPKAGAKEGKAPATVPDSFDHNPTTAEQNTWRMTTYTPWQKAHEAFVMGQTKQDPGPPPSPPWLKKAGQTSGVKPDYTNNNATSVDRGNLTPQQVANSSGAPIPALNPNQPPQGQQAQIMTTSPATSGARQATGGSFGQTKQEPAGIPASPTGAGRGVLANTQPAAQHVVQGDQHAVVVNGQAMKIDPPAAPPGAKAMSYNAKYRLWQFKMEDGRIVDEQGKNITFGD